MSKGVIITYVLVFGSIFLILIGGLLGFILLQLRFSAQQLALNNALHIAEAGINYYRWCLNHNLGENCQREKDYLDPSGAIIGHFVLEINQQLSCGQTIQENIVSRGWTNKFPNLQRRVGVLYARESVASYSYILNSDVWVGSDHEIRGPYRSNGGIRFDGENQSTVSSAKETWTCTPSFGCSTSQQRPGVFTTTSNSNPDLFQFPVPSFDFNGITIDLAQMKSTAQSSGIYLPPSNNLNPQGKGYHLKLKENGTLEVWIITALSPTYAYSLEEDWHYDYFTITSEYLYNTYNLPPQCSAIFIEDNIWPEGKVRGKVVIASANLINPNLDTDVILQGNIEYTLSDGSDGLTLISERNILISPQSPDRMELKGIFIAQKGRFSRNHYPNNIKEKLEILGSIVSNGRVGTQWVSGSQIVSGYRQRESYFDSNLIYNSPPFTPYINPVFQIVNWRELR
jgi:hypothetical protein